jgi:hypothetical protein
MGKPGFPSDSSSSSPRCEILASGSKVVNLRYSEYNIATSLEWSLQAGVNLYFYMEVIPDRQVLEIAEKALQTYLGSFSPIAINSHNWYIDVIMYR